MLGTHTQDHVQLGRTRALISPKRKNLLLLPYPATPRLTGQQKAHLHPTPFTSLGIIYVGTSNPRCL